MSGTAVIEFAFEEMRGAKCALRALAAAEFGLKSDGFVSYFVNDDGMFDWISVKVGVDRVSEEMDAAWNRGVVSGIVIKMPHSERGGELLFFPDRSVISFSATVDRKQISGSGIFTDLGWYCGFMVPALEPLGLIEVNSSDLA